MVQFSSIMTSKAVLQFVILLIFYNSRFFEEQNDRLFHTLLDISMSQDRTLTSEHMRSMGLDPVTDRAFLMELVEIYGIDVVLMVDNPCCPR